MTFAELLEALRRDLGPEIATQAAAAICKAAAGERVHIPKRPERPVILPTDTPQRLVARLGVSRRTSYRWLERWRK